MIIEQLNDEIIFRLPAGSDTLGLQRIVNYLKFKEATKDSIASEDDSNTFANQSKKDWWKNNKNRFIR